MYTEATPGEAMRSFSKYENYIASLHCTGSAFLSASSIF